MKMVQKLLVHICMICSIALVIVHILDWYNPFMDFPGHSDFVLYVLCAGTILSGIISIAADKKKQK